MSENSLEPTAEPDNGALNGAEQDGMAAVAQALASDTGEESGSEQDRPPAGVDDLCRLNICGPDRSLELAVPVHVPLIDLLPAMVGHLGAKLADAGLEHGGWVLQRLGDPPLREELSVAALGLHDGDTVHLRPRADQLPPLDFDDLIDGIAVGISGRSDRWRLETSRRLLTGLLAVPLAVALVLLAVHHGAHADILGAVAAVLLLGMAAAAARAFTDLPAATILAAAAIAYAGVAGAEAVLPHSVTSTSGGTLHLDWDTLRPALLAAAGAAAVMGAAAAAAVGGRKPMLVGTAATAVWVTAAAVIAVAARLSAAEAAGVALALLLPFSGWIPVLSFRLAGMRLDPLHTTPDELHADLDPLPGQFLVERTRRTDGYQNALYCGLAVVAVGCLIVLGMSSRWSAHLVVLDAAAVMLLQARVLASTRQRLAVILPAVGGLAVLSAAAGLSMPGGELAILFGGLVVTGGVLFAAERALPGRKSLPHWGWAGDILQTLTAVALIPLVLWLLNLYHYARAAHL